MPNWLTKIEIDLARNFSDVERKRGSEPGRLCDRLFGISPGPTLPWSPGVPFQGEKVTRGREGGDAISIIHQTIVEIGGHEKNHPHVYRHLYNIPRLGSTRLLRIFSLEKNCILGTIPKQPRYKRLTTVNLRDKGKFHLTRIQVREYKKIIQIYWFMNIIE
jgi:hypothetical protein